MTIHELNAVELLAVSRLVAAEGQEEVARIEAGRNGQFNLEAHGRMIAAEKEGEEWQRIIANVRRLRLS